MNSENKLVQRSLTLGVNACRFLLALVFLISGFIKANDTWGTVYKIQEYFVAWGFAGIATGYIPTALAWMLAIAEFWLGVNLFFGIRYRTSIAGITLLLAVMTPVTFWLAWTNAVTDCGCFGDALVLTHWETFFKNIALLGALYVISRWRGRIVRLVTDKVDWLIPLYSLLYIMLFMGYTSQKLPVFDFRPYHIGADIRSGMSIPPGEEATQYETTFVYTNGKTQKEFGIDHLPTDTVWQFVDSKTTVKKKGYEPPIRDFYITDLNTEADITDDILNADYAFLLVSPWLSKADDSEIDLINGLYDYAVEHKYPFYCVTASNRREIVAWEESTGAEYPFAQMDATVLKTMIRSNPGVLLLKRGVIINKWSDGDIPDETALASSLDTQTFENTGLRSFHRKAFDLVMLFVLPLFVLSLLDLSWLKWNKRRIRRQRLEEERPNNEI